MASKRSIYTLFTAGSLCLLLAALLYLLNGWFFNDAAYFHRQIEQNLQRQLSIAEAEMDLTMQKLAANPEMHFSVLPKDLQHQYYIFRNQNLWYWSDYHYVPSYAHLTGSYQYRFVNLKGGQFIVLKSEFSHAAFPNDQYEVFMLLPLSTEKALEQHGSRHNRHIFVSPDFVVRAPSPSREEGSIYSQDGLALFNVSIGKSYLGGPNQFKLWILIFLSLAGALWLLAFYRLGKSAITGPGPTNRPNISKPSNQQAPGYQAKLLQRFFLCFMALLSLRTLMLYYGFPNAIYPVALFDPQYYASSFLNPSLGDFMLNALLAGMFSLLILRFWSLRGREVHSWFRKKKGNPYVLSGLLFSQLLLLWLLYKSLHELFLHGRYTLDITSSLELNGFKLSSWFIFVLLTLIYILFNHILSICLTQASGSFHKAFAWHFSFVLLLLLLGIWWPSLLFAGAMLGVYLMVHLYVQRKNVVRPYNYQLVIFIFLSAIISALAASLALYSSHKQNRLLVKERFASQVLTDNDLIGEYLLSEAVNEIKEDPYIKSRFFSPLFSKEGVEQKIRRQYLTRYFDRYDATVLLFNVDGSVINHPHRYLNYHVMRERVEEGNFDTNYEGLYLLDDSGPGTSTRRYQQYIPILQGGVRPLGYILIDLAQKRYLTNTIYPELFFGQRLQDPQTGRLNYAVYRDGFLEFNAGEFDYVHQFSQAQLDDPELFNRGIEEDGFHHFGIRGHEGQTIVVSDRSEPVYLVFSNFSFLFLLTVLGITLLGLWYVLYYRISIHNLDFTAKIQLYLNAAVFVPLLVVSITTISLINSSFKRDTEAQYYNRAENISSNLSEMLEGRAILSARDSEELSNTLAEMARFAEVDIHFFGTRGNLLATSQPIIYQHNYLAAFINPQALAVISEQNRRQLILTETVNNLRYRSAYMAVRSSRSGALLGILSLPFFESGYQLEQQLAAVFSNIVNIFACLFIVFLALLYLLSRELTDPLRYIATKMKKVSLTGKNEPLNWPTQDEIGMLVREYNTMLLNLQASKEALSRSEKESAWREMAKQVAHEIKNPLTPMKLSLQHLNRMLKGKLANACEEEKVDKTVKSLLDQIDTLSDIATSFSAFAKMPVPKQERFEISSVLKGVVRLYSSQQQNIEAEIEDGPFWVLGDEQMMQRTFNNLILNGIQSVPEDRSTNIVVRLQALPDHRVLIEIRDNGEGIDEQIRDKVFVPNFSTKYTGSGLGLAIAKRGIEHAGGHIWFESEKGEGSSFFIELPLIPAAYHSLEA